MSRNQSKDKQRLVERLHKMPIVEAACKQVGLPRATYYRWRQDDIGFAKQCDHAIEQSAGLINDLAESQLISAIKDKNMAAITFWLKHHHRAYAINIHLQGKIQVDAPELTAEQQDLIRLALERSQSLLGANDDEHSQPNH